MVSLFDARRKQRTPAIGAVFMDIDVHSLPKSWRYD